jgi:hypothetical protein
MTSEMDLAEQATLTVLRRCGVELALSDLVRHVTHDSQFDQATVKASILRLNCEGRIEITPDWTVRSRVMESPVAAAA